MKKIVLIILAVVWLVVMFALSSADGSQTVVESRAVYHFLMRIFGENITHMGVRKAAHVFLYAVFGLLLFLVWSIKPLWARALASVGCAVAIAFIDELHKIPITGRHFSLGDSLLNVGAAVVGIAVCSVVSLVRR